MWRRCVTCGAAQRDAFDNGSAECRVCAGLLRALTAAEEQRARRYQTAGHVGLSEYLVTLLVSLAVETIPVA